VLIPKKFDKESPYETSWSLRRLKSSIFKRKTHNPNLKQKIKKKNSEEGSE